MIALTLDDAAQRALDRVQHPLGLDAQRAGQHLLGQGEPELDGTALELLGGDQLLVAQLGRPRRPSAASAGVSASSASARPAA